MTGPFADRLFRITFALAGCYNLAFGLWAAVWPLAFFELFQITPPRYPGIWACLGMVVGLYGLLYLHAAWRLETAWPIIAVGLLGKVLGPIGMVMSFGDDWPRRLGMLCIYNDLIWWLPFGLFLVRETVVGRRLVRLAPSICVVLHILALAAMALALRGGTLVEPDAAKRAAYIVGHVGAWSAGWAVWMLAAMSLLGFYAWWGSQIARSREQGARSRNSMTPISPLHAPCSTAATVAVVIAAIGMVFDFSGEGLSALVLVERAHVSESLRDSHQDSQPQPPLRHGESSIGEMRPRVAAFTNLERLITLLTAGVANGFYTLGGIILTLATRDLPRWVRGAMWTTWLAGLAMTVAAVVDSVDGMVVSTAVLFPLLICWTTWMGWQMTNE
jgi:hypothetical protein